MEDAPRLWKEALLRRLCVHAAFERMTALGQACCVHGRSRPLRHPSCACNQVDPVTASVTGCSPAAGCSLEKVEARGVAFSLDEELDSCRHDIPASLARATWPRAHLVAQAGPMPGDGLSFDDLLMPPLHVAVALEQSTVLPARISAMI